MNTAFSTAANWVLDQVVTALSDEDVVAVLGPAPTRVRIHWGANQTVPWDYCCDDGGQLTVAVGKITPMPRRDGLAVQPSCAGGWSLPMTVQVLRCGPKIKKDGTIDWAEADADYEARLDEALTIACYLLGQFGGTYEGRIDSMDTDAETTCRAVQIGLTVHLL